MANFRFILLCLGLLFLSVHAQIEKFGHPQSFRMVERAKYLTPIRMPEVDVEQLLAEDDLAPKDQPLRFAYGFEVAIDLIKEGSWEVLDNGARILRLSISSPGAVSMGLYFGHFYLPAGSSLYVYNDERTHVLGAFTSDNNKPEGDFMIRPCQGDTIIVEYNEKPNTMEEPFIFIARVNHGYRRFGLPRPSPFNYGNSGYCNINTACVEGWEDDNRAVAMILTEYGSRLCTGTLLNNAAKDSRQLFLTANHCLGGESSWVFMFNYESAACNPTNDGPTEYTVQGATLLAKRSNSDFALLEIREPIPAHYNVFMAGWNADPNPSQGIRGIHHPSGDVKKTSWFSGTVISDAWETTLKDTHWKIPSWTEGTTEPGSSGSPIFNSKHQVVGQLHGGTASCYSRTYDKYGKFAVSWNAGSSSSDTLLPWLDPENSGASEVEGMEFNASAAALHYANAKPTKYSSMNTIYA